MALRLGCCVGVKATETDPDGTSGIFNAVKAGFEYIELPLAAIAEKDEEGFEKLLSAVSSSGAECYACNLFLPGGIKITGKNVNEDAIGGYLDRALTRCAALGVKIIVFGSGGARNVEEGFSKDDAFGQLTAFLKIVSDKIEPYGIRIAIEPLNTKECNIINTFNDGLELARAVGRANINVLADYYHMCVDRDDTETLIGNGGRLIHTHIADLRTNRGFPLDKEAYAPFLDALYRAGYDGGISIEGNTGDFMADSQKSIEIFKTFSERSTKK